MVIASARRLAYSINIAGWLDVLRNPLSHGKREVRERADLAGEDVVPPRDPLDERAAASAFNAFCGILEALEAG
ncbi:hypothetical protein AYJ54_37365 [Bradyrhizobium centrolobii]|uniref:Uncharacterized protein n=1 Tax=Bradyrhizobium centrolobii TaxID=1505087 RepID=A0A176ZAW2_9BRAD|nr:hypothetical protein AYJ54_37365 [Bradyrhizobium centrolobii]